MTSPWCLAPDMIYLNHAAVSPWPRAARDAVTAFAEENAAQGAYDYPRWLQLEQQLRERLRKLINAGSIDDIALLKSTSEGLSFIAHGLDWQVGDSVVIPAGEFPSNRMVWQSLDRYGVELVEVDIDSADCAETALIEAIDDRTRLLSCSSVQYARGLRLDLNRLGQACQQHNVLFCVDAIQSLGAIRFDLQQCQADFVVADGHKWMTGPEGLALFYCRAELRERLQLHEYGWHMAHKPHDFNQTDWRPADSAQRFECGSPNMLGAVALNAALGVLLDHGIDLIEQQILHNSATLISQLDELDNVSMLTPADSNCHAGIVLFHCHGKDQQQICQQLMTRKIVCACRGNGVRFSPHYYQTPAQLEQAVRVLNELL